MWKRKLDFIFSDFEIGGKDWNGNFYSGKLHIFISSNCSSQKTDFERFVANGRHRRWKFVAEHWRIWISQIWQVKHSWSKFFWPPSKPTWVALGSTMLMDPRLSQHIELLTMCNISSLVENSWALTSKLFLSKPLCGFLYNDGFIFYQTLIL